MKTESMDAYAIAEYIKNAKKKTPIKLYVNGNFAQIKLPPQAQAFGDAHSKVIFMDAEYLTTFLADHTTAITEYVVESDRRNSAIPMLNTIALNARIEPGVSIRDYVVIGEQAVVMMGAIINIGAVVGDNTMVDMNAVLGAKVQVGKNCHVGAGAVLAGVLEPPSATPVVLEDHVLIGANAVVLEGVRIGEHSVVAAGSVVTQDVPPRSVVAGIPAKVIKQVEDVAKEKISMLDALRAL